MNAVLPAMGISSGPGMGAVAPAGGIFPSWGMGAVPAAGGIFPLPPAMGAVPAAGWIRSAAAGAFFRRRPAFFSFFPGSDAPEAACVPGLRRTSRSRRGTAKISSRSTAASAVYCQLRARIEPTVVPIR